jgi:hypothetical protein
MFKCKCPNATLSDQKLVLSLPDAVTPVVWMMDLSTHGTFVLKVEPADDGLFIVQKISTKGTVEDIAYYTKKSNAVRAMSTLSNAMNGNAANGLWGALKIGVALVVLVGVIYYAITPAQNLWKSSVNYRPSTERVDVTETVPQYAPTPSIETSDPNAVGVPLSADDFLKDQMPVGLPF